MGLSARRHENIAIDLITRQQYYTIHRHDLMRCLSRHTGGDLYLRRGAQLELPSSINM
jgi:hypothetical protein